MHPNHRKDVGKHVVVLVVEDDVVSRTALDMLLNASGYTTRAVDSAEEALQIAQSISQSDDVPIVALVDVDLPGMSGLDLLDRLENEHLAVPAVLVTATNHDAVSQWVDRGIPHVRKPVDFHHLLTVLSEQIHTN